MWPLGFTSVNVPFSVYVPVMVFAGFQNTAACGFVAWNPVPIVTNLIAPAPSGSEALVLRSGRTIQPLGAWATRGTTVSNESAVTDRYRFMAAPQEDD